MANDKATAGSFNRLNLKVLAEPLDPDRTIIINSTGIQLGSYNTQAEAEQAIRLHENAGELLATLQRIAEQNYKATGAFEAQCAFAKEEAEKMIAKIKKGV